MDYTTENRGTGKTVSQKNKHITNLYCDIKKKKTQRQQNPQLK